MSHTVGQSKWSTIQAMMLAFLAALITYVYFAVIQDNRLNEAKLLTRAQIAEQEGLLLNISQALANNGADAVTEAVVRDCSNTERASFDGLLTQLSETMPRQSLIELERLFGRCGGFHAERKSLMSARLEREVEVYAEFIEQASKVTGDDVSQEYSLADWQELAAVEKQQSNLFTELVTIQDTIITTLLQGEAAAVSLGDLTTQAQTVRESLLITNQQATTLRSSLSAI